MATCWALARARRSAGEPISLKRLEAGEDIEVQAVSRAEAMRMLRDGRLRDGKSIAALLMCFNGVTDRAAGAAP